MAQQFHLGKFLGNRYIDELHLLSPQYRSEEIFVISTDTNRTIQSATANMIGMFGQRARCGIDYPNLIEWPTPFVPVPIHSYEFMKDPIKCLEKLKNSNRVNNRYGSDPFSNTNTKHEGGECEWLERLKYYAHSAHDMTLSALFSTFQFDHTDFDRDGLPGYAACVLIELWRNNDKGYYIKVLYRRDNVDTLIDLTPHIRGCNGQQFGCSLELFKQRSLVFKPLPNQETVRYKFVVKL
uniref:2-phosphoxylose phosphatase 1 n=1 Tax=Meloidogyne hapla TaxID=6305 RepID=A0A1I8BUN2_MELHA